MTASELIENFRSFLISSWPSVSKILEQLDWDSSPYFLDIWIQANWEHLVEEHLLDDGQFLRPYGYNSSPGCRTSGNGCASTHQVTCVSKIRSYANLCVFLTFVAKKGSAWKIEPPFDHVDVEDFKTGKRYTIPIEEVDFIVKPIDEEITHCSK